MDLMDLLSTGGTLSDQDLKHTKWLHGVGELLNSARKCVDFLIKGHSVLVHCWEGWDRTPQIVSLAKIIGDEYYRTVEKKPAMLMSSVAARDTALTHYKNIVDNDGFKVLIRIKWVFGHRFAERSGIYGKDVKAKP